MAMSVVVWKRSPMVQRAFDGYEGDDPDVVAFLAALNAAVERDPLPVDPDEVWILWLGACLYIAVPVPTLQTRQGVPWLSVDLEICFWPAASHPGRGIELGWGDCRRPLDAQIVLRHGALDVREPGLSSETYATTCISWLREQLTRPLRLQGWTNASSYRVVLADSGDVVASRGRQRWRREPDVIEPLMRM